MSEIIDFLMTSKNIQLKCPYCGEQFDSNKSNLFDIRENYPLKIKNFLTSIIKNQIMLKKQQENKILKLKSQLNIYKDEQKSIKDKIRTKPKRIKTITTAINIGQIIEAIIPASKNFRYDVKDCRAIYKPIDYIAFNGLSKNKKTQSITIIEIKSGNARLQSNQRDIKEKIENGNIKYLEY